MKEILLSEGTVPGQWADVSTLEDFRPLSGGSRHSATSAAANGFHIDMKLDRARCFRDAN